MDVRVPNLGEGAESGTVVSILVKEGDQISQGQTILELENEKAVAPIPSPASGTVSKMQVKEGDKVSVGQIILSTSEGAGAPPPAAEKQPAPVRPKTQEPQEETREVESDGEHEQESRTGHEAAA